MNGFDAERIAALAARLRIAPRRLLALAGRVAQSPEVPLDAIRLRRELACVQEGADAADAAADLALLGYAAFALDDIDRGLEIAWSQSPGGEN
jgi:hypothetical protein